MKNSLEKALPIVARTISERYKGRLRVIMGASGACTNGKTIFLPTLPESNEARLLARGYIDHEAAHIRFTNFKIKNNFMTNALEDIRIEDRISREFAGAKKNLKALNNWFINQGAITVTEQDSDIDILVKYVHFKLRRDVLGNEVSSVLGPAETELIRRFGESLKKQADSIISAKLRSTADASRRAKKLYDLLPQAPEQDPGQDKQDQAGNSDCSPGSSGESGQAGGGSSENQDQNQGDQGQSGESDAGQGNPGQAGQSGSQADSGDGDESGEENSQGSGQDSGENQDSGQDSGENQNSGQGSGENPGTGRDSGEDQDSGQGGKAAGGGYADPGPASEGSFQGIGEAAREALNQIAREVEEGEFDPGSILMPTPSPSSEMAALNEKVKEEFRQAKNCSAKLRRRLQGVLEAKRWNRDKVGRSGKKISSKRIHRIACGDTRIFSKTIESTAVNTAIHLLLDSSGSMSGRDIALARQACYAIGLALEKTKYVNYAVSSFPGATGIQEIKRFNASLREECFNIGASGGTPTDKAMLYAAYTLAAQPEPRKMIFVITDGMPNRPLEARNLSLWLARHGVEVFGLTINDSDSMKVFQDSAEINNLDELAPSLFKILQKKL